MKTQVYIDNFITSCKARKLSPLTIKWYLDILFRFNNEYPKRPPKKPDDIDRFLLNCPGKDERRHGYYRALRCFYNFLERRYKYQNPIKYVTAPKRSVKYPAYFSPEEVYTLINYPHKPILKALLMLLVDTGCRIGEVLYIKPEDIMKTGLSYILKVNGKTGVRMVPISFDTYNAIIEFIPLPWRYAHLVKSIRTAISDAGLKGGAHKIRHTFATLWSGDEFTLKSITGHSDFDTLAIYRHMRVNNLCMQHNMHSPLIHAKGGFQDIMEYYRKRHL